MRRLSLLALSCALTIGAAHSAPTSPSDRGLFDDGAYPPQAAGLVTFVDLGGALDGYVTQVSLNSTLAGYLTTTAAAATYLPLAGGTITGNISAGIFGGSKAKLKIGSAVFEGQFGAPDSDLYQGSALAWNSLTAINGSGVFGETDFYNLQGLGSGGFAWCTGATVAACQSNVLMNLTSAGVVFGKGATITGNASISGTVTMSDATGTGNAYACITSAGVVYRSSTACN
ncbi:hypothetical protein [Gluconobacter wancherniae]|uniref:hypothetical protein n=1 Tax=Gluconobacter wancherniae TaxID=1307955 RepID=UPI001B8AF66B|nr:hypothetical protein [Gluconobacter wancherniae]MBS1088127.1 hypothetical protein [Gluconobacter wancherniae]